MRIKGGLLEVGKGVAVEGCLAEVVGHVDFFGIEDVSKE